MSVRSKYYYCWGTGIFYTMMRINYSGAPHLSLSY